MSKRKVQIQLLDDVSGTVIEDVSPLTDADAVSFLDGETFQQKLDKGELTGPQGDTGITGSQGPKGDKGDTGPAGKDAMPTPIPVTAVTNGDLDYLITSGVHTVSNVKNSPLDPTGTGAKLFSGTVTVYRYTVDETDYCLQMATYKKSTYLYFRSGTVSGEKLSADKTIWRSISNNGDAQTVGGVKEINLEKRYQDGEILQDLNTLFQPGVYTLPAGIYNGAPPKGANAQFTGGLLLVEVLRDSKSDGYYSSGVLQVMLPKPYSYSSGGYTVFDPSIPYNTIYYRVGSLHIGELTPSVGEWFCNWNAVGLMYDNNGVSILGRNHIKAYYNTEQALIVGADSAQEKNAFRVTKAGTCYATGYQSTGADYQVLFEWADGNPKGEDRRGLFVKLEGEKISPANDTDEIFGIIGCKDSASVIEDSASEEWQGKYERDVYGALISEEYTAADGTVQKRPKIAEKYDEKQRYIPRLERPEWDTVSRWAGKVVVCDDGTCEVNGYCTSGKNGIGTKSSGATKYRVISRIDGSHIRVVLL